MGKMKHLMKHVQNKSTIIPICSKQTKL